MSFKKRFYGVFVGGKGSTVIALSSTACCNSDLNLVYDQCTEIIGYIVIASDILAVFIEYSEIGIKECVLRSSGICLRAVCNSFGVSVSFCNTGYAHLVGGKRSSVVRLRCTACGNGYADLRNR